MHGSLGRVDQAGEKEWIKLVKSDTVGAIKLHTLLDLRGPIPSVIRVTDWRVHENVMLTDLVPEADAIYIMDRGYVDFARLYRFTEAGAFFVIRARKNLRVARVYSHPVDRETGLRSDHTVRLTGHRSLAGYPVHLRRIRFRDVEQARSFVFLTNAFTLPALTIPALYKCHRTLECGHRGTVEKRPGFHRSSLRRERQRHRPAFDQARVDPQHRWLR